MFDWFVWCESIIVIDWFIQFSWYKSYEYESAENIVVVCIIYVYEMCIMCNDCIMYVYASS